MSCCKLRLGSHGDRASFGIVTLSNPFVKKKRKELSTHLFYVRRYTTPFNSNLIPNRSDSFVQLRDASMPPRAPLCAPSCRTRLRVTCAEMRALHPMPGADLRPRRHLPDSAKLCGRPTACTGSVTGKPLRNQSSRNDRTMTDRRGFNGHTFSNE